MNAYEQTLQPFLHRLYHARECSILKCLTSKNKNNIKIKSFTYFLSFEKYLLFFFPESSCWVLLLLIHLCAIWNALFPRRHHSETFHLQTKISSYFINFQGIFLRMSDKLFSLSRIKQSEHYFTQNFYKQYVEFIKVNDYKWSIILAS